MEETITARVRAPETIRAPPGAGSPPPPREPEASRGETLAEDRPGSTLRRRTLTSHVHRSLSTAAFLGSDALVLFAAVWAGQRGLSGWAMPTPLAFVVPALWGIGLVSFGVPSRARSASHEFRRTLKLTAFVFVSAALVFVAVGLATHPPRSWWGSTGLPPFLVGTAATLALVVLFRMAAQRTLAATGLLHEPAVVYGRAAVAAQLSERLSREGGLGVVPVGVETLSPGRSLGSVPVGPPEAFVGVMSEAGLDPDEASALLDRLLSAYPTVLVVPDLRNVPPLCVSYSDLDGTFAMRVGNSLASPVTRGGKRAAEVVLVLATAPLWLPLCAAVAAVVWLEDRSHPIFAQQRVGRGGRPFDVYKFRTMRPNAEEVLRRELESDGALREEWEGSFKLRVDPRVTRVGRLLRASSLDELPQLANVLLGDMSLVGPRPLPRYHHDQLPARVRSLREQVAPGITGLWQVSGRSEAGTEGMARWDPYYVRNWSLWLDAEVVARTVGAVLRSRGAY